MQSAREIRRRFSVPNWAVPVIGALVSIVFLFFSFRKFDWPAFGHDMRHLAWPWVIAGVAAELLSYIVDAWRWLVILSPAEQPTLLQCVQATFIGLFANDVLPAKAGEVIRPYLLTRWAKVPFSLSLTSAVIERVFDGLVMVLCFYAVRPFIRVRHAHRLDAWVTDGMATLAVAVFLIAAALLFVIFYKAHAHRVVSKRKWAERFLHVIEELHCLANWKTLALGFAMSFGYFFCQFAAMYCLMRSYDYGPISNLGFDDAVFTLLVVRLVTLIPSAPGNLGSFNFICARALEMVGLRGKLAAAAANRFAVAAYILITAPPLVVGALAVVVSGLSINELHKQAHHAHREHEERLRNGSGNPEASAAPETSQPEA